MATTLDRRPQLLVIGTGVGGAFVAHRAAEAGLDVVMLDCGPRLDRATLVDRFRRSAGQSLMAPYPLVPHAPQPNVARTDDYLIQTGPEPYAQQYIRSVGGTTWHWGGATWRFTPEDMKLRTLYGRGRDWPIDYWELEPYYQIAEEEMGVAGPEDAAGDAPRDKPYPMPPQPLSYMDQVWHERLTANGYEIIHAPQCKNNQQVYDGRPPCCGNANCMPICPIGAQYGAVFTVNKAEAAGAELMTDCVVHGLEVGEGGRITAARFLRPDGEAFRIEADRFALAANGIEGPKIMLMSGQEGAPDGVGNSSGQVGRNLMDHPGTSDAFDSAEPLWPGRGPNILSAIMNLRDGPFRRDMASRKMMPDNYPKTREVAAEAVEEGLTGRELQEAIRHRAARRMVLYSFNEQLPDPVNTIRPSDSQTDPLGIPRPEIHYTIDDYVRRAADDTKARAKRIGELFGATEVKHTRFLPNNHISGATIMGDDPRDSVVDASCRAHDHPNLWISSSSTFPSVAAVNVTLTIGALAARIADDIVAEARP